MNHGHCLTYRLGLVPWAGKVYSTFRGVMGDTCVAHLFCMQQYFRDHGQECVPHCQSKLNSSKPKIASQETADSPLLRLVPSTSNAQLNYFVHPRVRHPSLEGLTLGCFVLDSSAAKFPGFPSRNLTAVLTQHQGRTFSSVSVIGQLPFPP